MGLDDFIVLLVIVFIVLGILGISAGIVLGIVYIDYKLNDYEIIITQDNQTIYEGIKSCISVYSTGDTTTIKEGRGFLCMFPKAITTGKNIEIITKEVKDGT